MTVPQPLHLFSPHWLEPLNTRTQVDRLPPIDAPCICRGGDHERPFTDAQCRFPFCDYPARKPPEKEDE